MTERMLRRAGATQVQRTDDNLESFRKRIVTYNEQTMPIVDIFRQNNALIVLNAERLPDEILDEFLAGREFEF
jgi:adenylate kinase family enzyme